MISGHSAATSKTLFAGGGEGDRLSGIRNIAESLECPHSRLLARGADTAISQATTVPFGGIARPDSQETEHTSEHAVDIEVGSAGEDKDNDAVATAGDASTSVATPEGGISDALDELRPLMEPPVPADPNRIPARKSDSVEEFIPDPPTAEPLGHHTSALERLLVKRGDKDSSGSESSRKPPPPKVFRLESPDFGQDIRPKDRKSPEAGYFDVDPPGKGAATDQEDELRSAQALPVPHVPPPRSRRDRSSPYDNDTPPWVSASEGRLLAHLEPLKADVSDISCRQTELHREIAQFAAEVRKQGERLDSHDAALHNQNKLHQGSLLRIEALEKEVKELRAASRSPTPSRAPPSPGNRSLTPTRECNIEEELQMVIGGWEDCKRDEAVEEAKAIFEAAKIPNAWLEIWSPYSRTSHVRVILQVSPNYKTIPQQRAFQTEVLEKLESRKWTSNVPGNEGRVIWIQRHRTPEDRAKIRAIVSVKEFIDQLTFGEGLRKRHAEIDWRGKLFVGNVNVLGNPSQTDSLQEHDFPLSDPRGNHTGWFINAEQCAKATGLPAAQLPELWESRTTSALRGPTPATLKSRTTGLGTSAVKLLSCVQVLGSFGW